MEHWKLVAKLKSNLKLLLKWLVESLLRTGLSLLL